VRTFIIILIFGAAAPACTSRIVPIKPSDTIVDGHRVKLAGLISWGSPTAMEIDVDTPDEVGLMAVRVGRDADSCGAGNDLVVLRAKAPGTEGLTNRVWDLLVPIPEVDPTVPLPNFLPPARRD